MRRVTNARILHFALSALLTAGLAGANQSSLDRDQVWSHTSAGEGITSYAVSMGNFGSQVFSDAGFAHHRTRLFSAHRASNVAPEWETDIDRAVYNPRVASAQSTDLHFSLVRHQNPTNPTLRDLVLRAWRSGSEQPIWTRTLASNSMNDQYIWVRCNRDGSRVVTGTNGIPNEEIWVHDGRTGAELENYPLTLFSFPTEMEVSEDAEVMLVMNSIARQVVHIDSGQVLHNVLGTPTMYGGAAISADGDVFGVSAGNSFQVFRKHVGAGYTLVSEFDGASNEHAYYGTLSADGRIAAAAFLVPGASHARVVAWNTDTDTVLLNKLYTGSGSLRTYPTGLAISKDGRRLVLAMTGDGTAGQAPELAVFESGYASPYFATRALYDLPGSVMDISLSDDGSRLATCGRTSHATMSQTDKVYALYQFDRDLVLEGTPNRGSVITARIQGEPGKQGYLVVATEAAPTPLQLPIGVLYVRRSSLYDVIPAGTIGATGEATASFTIPWTSSHDHYFFQAFTGSPRLLNKDWDVVTVP